MQDPAAGVGSTKNGLSKHDRFELVTLTRNCNGTLLSGTMLLGDEKSST